MKITYLIGAGASAENIPTVKDFPKKLIEFRDYIRGNFPINNDKLGENTQLILNDLNCIIEETSNHASFDTYAKKLYLTNQKNDLIKLKNILDSFLTAIQITNRLDKRYDLFLATILNNSNGKLNLPQNISIISWNYDFQLELSLNNFYKKQSFSELDNEINLYPNSANLINENEFSIFKLNGTAGGILEEDKLTKKNYFDLGTPYNLSDSKFKKSVYESIIKNYSIMHKTKQISSIIFSWENDNEIFKNLRDGVLKIISDTSILVVIGYSFPTFNRNIDKLILANMQKLFKIIVQVHDKEMNAVISRLNEIISKINGNVQIIPNNVLDEFFIPFEFN